MELLLKLPENCMLNKTLPANLIFSEDDAALCAETDGIIWIAALKPGILDVEAVITATIRYEEIQIIRINIRNTEDLYPIAHKIYKKIKYPCILIFKYRNKYCLSACPFSAGKKDYDENILRNICFSHWIHSDLITIKAQKMIDTINSAIRSGENLEDMYSAITYAIQLFQLSGINKSRTERIIHDLLGGYPGISCQKILSDATTYKKYIYRSKVEKFNRQSTTYRIIYDYEDIWYCLVKFERTRKVIEGRRYKDIEELIYSCESKSW